MKNFILNINFMFAAKKYRKHIEQCERDYQWYKYLVIYDINRFFNRLKFWKQFNNKNNNSLPF